MSFIQKFNTSFQRYNNGDTRIGEINRIWYDANTNTLRIGDGTPGGRLISGGTGTGTSVITAATTSTLGGIYVGPAGYILQSDGTTATWVATTDLLNLASIDGGTY
jgi:hypothetical protein